MTLSLLCSPKLHLFDQKYSKNTNIMKYYCKLKKTVFYINIFKNVIYPCDEKQNVQSSVSLGPSEKSY